jgi:RNA polymerase sigma factor (sigma-70 family)
LVVARNEANACVRREVRHSFGYGPSAVTERWSGADRSGSDDRAGGIFEPPVGACGGSRGRVWEELVDDGPPPWQGLLQGEEVERLRGATERLSPEQAEVIRCRFVDGLTFQEIADRLEIPLGTALSRARAAILRLKRDLER